MESVKQTAADILNSAAWNLENNIIPWGKRAFYKFLSQDPENTECQMSSEGASAINKVDCMMCAHGAIGYFGNDEIKKLIGKKEAAEARDVAATGTVPTPTAAYYKDRILKGEFGEVGKAHYLAWKAGLSYSFNDDPKTTKEMVVEKLREAAKLYPKINEL